MSSEIMSTEKVQWTTHLKLSSQCYRAIRNEAEREDRSVSQVIARALEAHFEKKTRLAVF